MFPVNLSSSGLDALIFSFCSKMPNWLLMRDLLVKLGGGVEGIKKTWQLQALELSITVAVASDVKILGQAKSFLQNQNESNWTQFIH